MHHHLLVYFKNTASVLLTDSEFANMKAYHKCPQSFSLIAKYCAANMTTLWIMKTHNQLKEHSLLHISYTFQDGRLSTWLAISAERHPGTSDQNGKIWKFWPGKRIFLRNFAPMQWGRKFLCRIFYTFWPPYGRNFRFGTFDPEMGKKSWRETLNTTGAEFRNASVAFCTVQSATWSLRTRWVKFETSDLEKVFSFRTLHQWCPESFSPVFFIHFGHPTAENFDSVRSTRVRPFPYIGTFDQWCD